MLDIMCRSAVWPESALAALPDRRAFFQEGDRAFLGVLAGEHQRRGLAADLEAGRHVDARRALCA